MQVPTGLSRAWRGATSKTLAGIESAGSSASAKPGTAGSAIEPLAGAAARLARCSASETWAEAAIAKHAANAASRGRKVLGHMINSPEAALDSVAYSGSTLKPSPEQVSGL